MELIKKNLGTWIKAAVILTIGILFIIMGAAKPEASGEAAKAINVIVGIVLLVVGALALVLAIVAAVLAKKGFLAVAVPGAIAIALGVSILASESIVTQLTGIVLFVVPYILIAIGALIIGDAIFRLVLSIKAKTVKDTLFAIIMAIVVGLVILTLGILCVNGWVISGNAQLIILGIVLIVVALLQVLFTFVKGPEAVVTIVGVKSASKEDKE